MWQWHVRAESYSSWNTSKASRMTLRRSLKSSGRRRQEVRQRRSGGMSTNERAPLRTRKTKLPKRPFLVLIFRRLQRFCKLKVVRQLQKSNELSKREFWYSILTKWRNISRLLTRNIFKKIVAAKDLLLAHLVNEKLELKRGVGSVVSFSTQFGFWLRKWGCYCWRKLVAPTHFNQRSSIVNDVWMGTVFWVPHPASSPAIFKSRSSYLRDVQACSCPSSSCGDLWILCGSLVQQYLVQP